MYRLSVTLETHSVKYFQIFSVIINDDTTREIRKRKFDPKKKERKHSTVQCVEANGPNSFSPPFNSIVFLHSFFLSVAAAATVSPESLCISHSHSLHLHVIRLN